MIAIDADGTVLPASSTFIESRRKCHNLRKIIITMLAVGTKIGAFAPFISATSQNVASQLRPAVVVAPSLLPTFKIPTDVEKHTNRGMSALAPRSNLKVTSGVQCKSIINYYLHNTYFK